MMRNLLHACAALALVIPLSSCGAVTSVAAAAAGLPSAPVQVCDRTMLDEQAGRGVELGYKTFRLLVEVGVLTGQLHGETATRFARLDNQLYQLTLAVQSAYRTCNAASYRAAIGQAQAALSAAIAAFPRS